VVDRYLDGWLICDDGAGEVADFVHLALNGDLTVIHVKAAGRGRRVPAMLRYHLAIHPGGEAPGVFLSTYLQQ
jgi:hypothetical protein